jgi:hypothetical protein
MAVHESFLEHTHRLVGLKISYTRVSKSTRDFMVIESCRRCIKLWGVYTNFSSGLTMSPKLIDFLNNLFKLFYVCLFYIKFQITVQKNCKVSKLNVFTPSAMNPLHSITTAHCSLLVHNSHPRTPNSSSLPFLWRHANLVVTLMILWAMMNKKWTHGQWWRRDGSAHLETFISRIRVSITQRT